MEIRIADRGFKQHLTLSAYRSELRKWYESMLGTHIRRMREVRAIKRNPPSKKLRGRAAVVARAREIDLLRREDEIRRSGATVIAWARQDGIDLTK